METKFEVLTSKEHFNTNNLVDLYLVENKDEKDTSKNRFLVFDKLNNNNSNRKSNRNSDKKKSDVQTSTCNEVKTKVPPKGNYS